MAILNVFCCVAVDTYHPRTVFASTLFLELYIGCTLLSIVPRVSVPAVRGIFYIVIYGLAIINVFVFTQNGTVINPTIILLLLETNKGEASEFIRMALSSDVLLSPTGVAILLACAHGLYTVLKLDFWRKLADAVLKIKACRAMVGLVLAVSIIVATPNSYACYKVLTSKTLGEVELNAPFDFFMPFDHLVYSSRCNQICQQQIERMKDQIDEISVDSCTAGAPNILLIIGESYTRHHSQLYGYSMPTTPRQSEREERGELTHFTDVVTPWNITSYVFKHLFTMHTIGDKGEWHDNWLFPIIFRKAGYHVTFITNQFVQNKSGDIWSFSGDFFLNNPALSDAQFDERNVVKHNLDMGLVQDLDSMGTGKWDRNLVIASLRGQHASFNERFPAEYAKFKAEDYYESRPELNKEQCQIVADYDNATLYNDYIVNEFVKRFEDKDAIVIYVPDHGEETFDNNRKLSSRCLSPIMDYDFARAEFEIPFWIWGSPTYRQSHPDEWQNIVLSKDRPLMTDALAHTLLRLAGIHCKEYKPKYDILAPQYDASRPRLLRAKDDYDVMRSQAQ